MNKVIEVRGLEKRFGAVRALEKVSFEVRKGSIVGFLGPNGAGKSTAMNVLLGFLNKTAGTAKIFGENVSVSNSEIHKRIGYLSANMSLDDTLTAGQELEYFGNLKGVYNEKEIKDLAGKLGLDLKAKVGSLSTGNHQKVALIIALMGAPELLILDEPTNGLDPLVQDEFNKIILDLRDKGSTIFISSHILSEVEELCDEFVFIRGGKIVGRRARDDLKKSEEKQIVVSAKDFGKVEKFLKEQKIKFTASRASNLSEEFMSYYKESDIQEGENA
jgi:ABC-2 type transport system ATP-binding protein